jgi:hypothetical protein
MALLSERQQTAQMLAREINHMGAWCVSPLPLDDSARLRFQVLDSDRQKVLEILSSWNWSPTFCGTTPRICPDGWKLASVYEIDLPRERQTVADDRIPHGEVSSPGERRKTPEEVLHMRRYLGWTKK